MKRPACALLATALLLQGCSTAGYYLQAVEGHLDIMERAHPIRETVDQADTPAALRQRLERVLHIRDFASRELGLPDNGSYRSYADLGRPYALWNVFAAPEFSVEPKKQCLLFVGCVSYRGFYSEQEARRYAEQLRSEGYDAYVGGVPAYSTLGYFNDPVLSTFVRAPEPDVARLIFHELAHQVVYVRGDTAFNESFATAVEQEGVRRWLTKAGDAAERAAWEASQSRRRDFVALVTRYRERLADFYAQPGSVEEKLAGKHKLFDEMRADYQALKKNWGGFAGYDRYFNEHLNNAFLAVVAAYTVWVPAFNALLARDGGDLGAFYADVKSLARLGQEERTARLRTLDPSASLAGVEK